MPKIIPTKYSLELADALRFRGIDVELEYWDGHKHIDIYIPKVSIYIEIDGMHHFIDPNQIEADFKREFYSEGSNIDTFHIPNEIIYAHLNEIADAIAKVAKDRISKTTKHNLS